jgi:MinD-like ATPase involved in chromosome partitioning or flagellar assembly
MNNKLYTWIDVQDWLEIYFNKIENQSWLENINFRSYWDGLTVYFAKPKQEVEILDKLEEIFAPRLDTKTVQPIILLERNQSFPVFFEEVDITEIDKLTVKPTLLRNPFVGQKEAFKAPKPLAANFFAFHSFKGGVGRTLHAIALALHLVDKKRKVLLIDADFEAPGISWLLNQTYISFADFLALIHGQRQHENIIETTTKILKDNDLENGNLFVLPAFRGLKNGTLPTLEIKPEHIYSFSENPFFLSDILDELATKLGVDDVILDLRAGVSELSSGWFFDPRIYKVFVSTLSSQALLGTAKMFDILSQFDKDNKIDDYYVPFLVISQVPQNSLLTEKSIWENSTQGIGNPNLLALRKKYVDSFISTEREDFKDLNEDEIIASILATEISPYTLFSAEKDSLKSLPDTWHEVAKLVRETGLQQEVQKLNAVFLSNHAIQDSKNEDFTMSREKLKKVTDNLVFADNDKIERAKFLVTNAIENLIKNFRSQLPIVVIVGAKGSGKTFLYKQLWFSKNWQVFVKELFIDNNNHAFLFPVTIPQNGFNKFPRLNPEIRNLVNYTGSENIWEDTIQPHIKKSLASNFTTSEWREKWLDYMAWAVGYQVGVENVGRSFVEFLKDKKTKMIAIFDGLEDLFVEFNAEKEQQIAILALLQDVPNWLARQAESYLGIIVFVRKDIVRAAITQNSGQFLDSYKEYELKWNAEEALRLVHWVLNEFEIFNKKTFENKELKNKIFEDLVVPLYKLWGKKLGSDKSKEAYTSNWVLGVLANLKKEVQSRDIIHFLNYAVKKTMESKDSKIKELYKDRLFYPSAIRDSIKDVGTDKINEVKTENKPLKQVLEILEKNTTKIKFPVNPDDLKNILKEEKDIELLVDNGVIILHQGEYYMASIYQQSMGFATSRAGKPKVLYF